MSERQHLRTIKILGNRGRSKNWPGPITDIYYLQGDEKEAAKRFVEENKEQLQNIDFTKNRNPIQVDLNRELYDWVLHYLGERSLRKFPTVVIEERSDGATWVLDREHFEKGTARRYTISDQVAARIQGTTLESIYDQFEDVITESDLREIGAIEGDVRFLLDAYRSAPEFNCRPVSGDGELALEKQTAAD